jgi:hypothetical protein
MKPILTIPGHIVFDYGDWTVVGSDDHPEVELSYEIVNKATQEEVFLRGDAAKVLYVQSKVWELSEPKPTFVEVTEFLDRLMVLGSFPLCVH